MPPHPATTPPGPAWHPSHVHTWTKTEVQTWFDLNGNCGFRDGSCWQPLMKRLSPDSYEVKFVRYLG